MHYVSPTVWAWRPGRIKSIARNVDLMLTLYPFETDIYLKNGVDVAFVGHPKAYEIELDEGTDKKAAARQMLDYREDDPIVAILPGSRRSEVTYSGPDFFAAAGLIKKAAPGCRFLVAAANDRLASNINSLLLESGQNLDIKVVVGRSREVLTAADVVLVNSGTATLEAMLLKKPMVMSYRLGSATYALVSRLVKTKYFALPNILAGHELVPELIQKDATPEALSKAVLALFNPETRDSLITKFDTIHRQLRVEKYEAAQAILTLCGEKPGHGEADVSP